jgi:isopenicillin N synthase-like dioxygenase
MGLPTLQTLQPAQIPLIDLSAEPPAVLAQRINQALCAAGFFGIAGHGVAASTVQAAFGASHRFFALPELVKTRWHVDGGGIAVSDDTQVASAHSAHVKRGFDPMGWQALDPLQPPDVKESFYMGQPLHGVNRWPDEAQVPGFRAACQSYSNAMQVLARRLMGLFELALDLPAGHFNSFMQEPMCTTRLLHYPPQPAVAAPGQIGCGAHTDWGALTLLAQDDAGGLQVQSKGGAWIDVPPVPDALVVNIGDMMQRWTNDRWPSTLHRVINQRSGHDRWSIAYFFDLDADAVVKPLASCVSATNPARYAALTAGEHLAQMYQRTTVAATKPHV